ncbi:MAG: PEP-CTERM sorting domain-containing protein [Planctomycetota bacterium]
MFQRFSTWLLSGALVTTLAPAGFAQIAAYSENFESLDGASPTALGDAGFQVFASVFSDLNNPPLYSYGPFPAPNNAAGPAFSLVTANAPDGSQAIVTLTDYNNGDLNSNTLVTSVFQEQTIGAADIGKQYEFSFIAAPDTPAIGSNSSALAFIKTLDPNDNFATTNFLTFDTTSLASATNASIVIDLNAPELNGQIIQYGFETTSSAPEPTGVIYDNLSFDVVPEPASLALIGLGGLMMATRRRTAR